MPESRGRAQRPSTGAGASSTRPDQGPSPNAGQEPSANAGQNSAPTFGPHSGMLMRMSVPAEGGLRELAGAVATKIAEYLGSRAVDSASIGTAIEGLAGKVAPPGGGPSEITFEFHAGKGELVVHAHCDGRSSELHHRLPA